MAKCTVGSEEAFVCASILWIKIYGWEMWWGGGRNDVIKELLNQTR
jgi:hypothetical protein